MDFAFKTLTMKLLNYAGALFLSLFLNSCESDDETLTAPSEDNSEGAFFKGIIFSEEPEVIQVYHEVAQGPDMLYNYEQYSFPGNNYIKLWNDGTNLPAMHYNLELVERFEIDFVNYYGNTNDRREALILYIPRNN